MQRRALCGILLLTLLLTLGSQNLLAQQPAGPDGMIRLKNATFDPLSGEPALAPSLRSSPAAAHDTYLLQFSGAVQESWKAAATQAGARLFGYIPENTFIAQIDANDLARLRALPFVRWIGLYHPAYRLESTLAQLPSSSSTTVEVQTLPNADLDALRQAIAGWSGSVAGSGANPLAGYIRATLPASRLGALAALDGVLWVGPYQEPRLANNVGGGQIMRANDVRQDLKLFGAGQIVAVADTGLDIGNLAGLHPDFQGRVIKTYCLGRSFPCNWNDTQGHGTHVSGSVLGSGAASGSTPAAHLYPNTAFAGIAPEARLVMQSILDSLGGLGGIPNDEGDLMRQAYADGARIHTNSWGSPTGGTVSRPTFGAYVIGSQDVDFAAWQYKDMLILFSAGNDGTDANGDGVIDADSMEQPATAKNILTVGASESLRSSGGVNPGGICDSWGNCGFQGNFGTEPITSDHVSDNQNGMAAFSSRGPTDDGRIKPDIVAPGTNIISTRSHMPQAGTGWGIYNADYMYDGGTSMSTPLTAGAAALVREWLTRFQGMSQPSSALLKSLLINGAADMNPGQYGIGPAQEIPSQRPNNVTGWGRVDLHEAIDPTGPRKLWFTDNRFGAATGTTITYTVELTSALVQRSQIGPQASTQLLQNGDFEAATLAPWTISGNTALDVSTTHGGAHSAHLGGADNADAELRQSLTIPANASAASIDFWYQISTDETLPGADKLCYGLWNAGLTVKYSEDCSDLGALGETPWSHKTVTLSPSELASVAGKPAVLRFSLQNNASAPSEVWLDDATLTANTPSSPPPTDPLRVTLAWTDYPGQLSAAKALVNDLDLEVIGPDNTHYRGNQGLYSSGQCLRAGAWDSCNNVEGVLLPAAGLGTYRIVVHGVQVPQGGSQPFALAASGDGLRLIGGPVLPQRYLPIASRPVALRSQALGSMPAALLPLVALPALARKRRYAKGKAQSHTPHI